MIGPADIKNICTEIYDFSQNADLRFEKNPVLTYEFKDISEFTHARRTILSSMDHTLYQAYIIDCRNDESNASGEVIEEIDYCGVTIRLICNQQIFLRGDSPLAELELDHRE